MSFRRCCVVPFFSLRLVRCVNVYTYKYIVRFFLVSLFFSTTRPYGDLRIESSYFVRSILMTNCLTSFFFRERCKLTTDHFIQSAGTIQFLKKCYEFGGKKTRLSFTIIVMVQCNQDSRSLGF